MDNDRHPSPSAHRSGQPDLSLVIPCYNEEALIRNTAVRLVQSFGEKNVGLELVLVDNGSQDGTGQIIDSLIAEGLPVVKKTIQVNQGYGNGILCGLRATTGQFVGYTHADEQVTAQDTVKMYEIVSEASIPQLAKVRRRFRMDGLVRKIISIVYNLMTNALFGGLGSIDINGSPKILPRTYLECMNLQSKDWFLDAEILIKAKRLGLTVFEMNVLAQMRGGGTSHVRPGTCWEFLLNLLKCRFGGQDRMQMKSLPMATHNKAQAKLESL